MLLEKRRQARFTEEAPIAGHRLADAVGEKEQQIARLQRNRDLAQQSLESLAVVQIQAQHHARGRQHAGAPPGVGRDADEGRVARAGAGERLGRHIDHRVDHRDETAIVEVARDDAIGLDEQRARRAVNAAQRQHQSFQLGHVQRRRRALP